MMLDNLVNAIRTHSDNWGATIKQKSRTVSGWNWSRYKYQALQKASALRKSIRGSNKDDDADNWMLSPRAYSMTTFSIDYTNVVVGGRDSPPPLGWTNGTSTEDSTLYQSHPPIDNIVDRFNRVITIDDYGSDDENKPSFGRYRRTDREEIRRRLAMGPYPDDYQYYTPRPGRKSSLQARLQSGMNLQICFMNESVSDSDSPASSDTETVSPNANTVVAVSKKMTGKRNSTAVVRPQSLALRAPDATPITSTSNSTEDFFVQQVRLQTEAKMALAQAKQMARMQMQIEKERQVVSPITEMLRSSMAKVGIPLPESKRRLSRQLLTDMNVAQLQVIVNDLHTQIEKLNERLVKFLMERDELHMGQDSMLVDIEDLTRYLGAKELVLQQQTLSNLQNNNSMPPPSPAPPTPLDNFKTLEAHYTRLKKPIGDQPTTTLAE